MWFKTRKVAGDEVREMGGSTSDTVLALKGIRASAFNPNEMGKPLEE